MNNIITLYIICNYNYKLYLLLVRQQLQKSKHTTSPYYVQLTKIFLVAWLANPSLVFKYPLKNLEASEFIFLDVGGVCLKFIRLGVYIHLGK